MLKPIKAAFFIGFALFAGTAQGLPADVRPVNDRDYLPEALKLVGQARQSVRAIMYLAQSNASYPRDPVLQLLQALADARARGVDVAVLLERPREKFASSRDLAEKNRRVKDWLIEHGIPAYQDSVETTTHAKVLVVDKRYIILGSTNWTYSALARNHEASVLIDSAALAGQYMEYFERIRKER